jgi:triacylglycerol lipase
MRECCRQSRHAALATYLSLETAVLVSQRVSAVMFASPHTGNHVFTAYYDTILGDRYSLYNYVLDLVPYVPFSLPLQNIDYAALPKATIINPVTSQADVRVDVGCNHHIICYCAELAYEYTASTPKSPADQALFKCVIGPREVSGNEALAELLALAFKAFLANEAMLKQAATKMGWHPI